MADNPDQNPYGDIINLPHHVSPTRPRMSMADRAAQFSPFAALSGYGDAVKETARLTGQRIELDESAKAALDEKLRLLAEVIEDRPEAVITRPLAKLSKAVKVADASNQGKTEGKALSSVTVTFREDTKPFGKTDGVFNKDTFS